MRNTAFTRTMEYFRTAGIDEATAALAAARGIIDERTKLTSPARKTRTRKARTNGAGPDVRHSQMTQEATA